MRAVSVLAAGALSALGRGAAAYAVGAEGAPGPLGLKLRPGWPLKQPLVGAVDDALVAVEGDRATRLLCTAARDLAESLDVVLPEWRRLKLGLVVGTSSGGMQSIERALECRAEGRPIEPALAEGASYWLPLQALETQLGVAIARDDVAEVLAACVSSSLALGLASRWLEAGRCELVIAGGYDALSSLVAAGFDALAATTRTRPRPFASDRDGMALGEGAVLLALTLATRSRVLGRGEVGESSGRGELGRIMGFGASSDAAHVTAPDREGRGLHLAASAALDDAGLDSAAVDFVSAHATATPYNDEAESRALERLFSREVVVQPWKAAVGHTLGAGGALESLAALDALVHGLAPAAPGVEAAVQSGVVRLLPRNEQRQARRALKLSAAFGGSNAALVLAAPGVGGDGKPRARSAVALAAVGKRVRAAEPEAVLRWAPQAPVLRADSLSELVVAAVAALFAARGAAAPAASALIVATSTATLELDERFDARRRSAGVAEPRRFPATSPNLCAGFGSICFGLHGPAFSVGGPDPVSMALSLGRDLIALGDVPAALIVTAEDVGEAARELFLAAGRAVPERGARAAWLEAAAADSAGLSQSEPARPDPLAAWRQALTAARDGI